MVQGAKWSCVFNIVVIWVRITVDGDCSHEIKRHLLLGRKAMTNLDSVLQSRDITLLTKVHIVKAVVFSVVMYRCENLTTEKAESQRTDAFELWCWRRLWRAPWTARSNQSILKEINPEYSLEGLMLKLKRQYFGYLMWIADLLEKTLMLGKIEGKRRRGMTKAEVVRWHHWLNGHEFKQTLRDSGGRWTLVCCCPWDRKSWTGLSDWTTTKLS